MLKSILILILITIAPVFELRGSIPLGILKEMLHPAWVVIICLIANIAVAPLVYILLKLFLDLICRIDRINRLYEAYKARITRKLEPLIKKYGTIGLAIFIGIPLPGSGVYSGAVGAHALGMGFKKYMIAATIGVLIAGTIVTIITLGGVEWLDWMLNKNLIK